MDLRFSGEVVDFYQRYRRGYPAPAVGALCDAFTLTGDDVVVDLGCGTGQLTFPMAERVRAVGGMDPSPDMLEKARRAGVAGGVGNVSWLLGGDTDIPAIAARCGGVGAVTIGQALHWMDHERLFAAIRPMLRKGGGVAVVTNGLPLWSQESAWSRALDEVLAGWFDRPLTVTCGTDEISQTRYGESLAAAGYAVDNGVIEYRSELTLDQIVGGVYSALSEDGLPAHQDRATFADRIRMAIEPHAPYVEPVSVKIVTGRC